MYLRRPQHEALCVLQISPAVLSLPGVVIADGNAASGPGRIKLVLDAGLLMQGSADISLSSDSGLVSQDDIDAEIEELEEKAEDYDFWPVLSIGISFRI